MEPNLLSEENQKRLVDGMLGKWEIALHHFFMNEYGRSKLERTLDQVLKIFKEKA